MFLFKCTLSSKIDPISFTRSGSNTTKRRLAELNCTWLLGYTGNSCMDGAERSCNRRITSLSYWNCCSGYSDWFRLDVSVCCCWYNPYSNTLIVLKEHMLVPSCDTMHLQISKLKLAGFSFVTIFRFLAFLVGVAPLVEISESIWMLTMLVIP